MASPLRGTCKLGGGSNDGRYIDVPVALANELMVPVSGSDLAVSQNRRPRFTAADLERYIYRGTQHGLRFYRAAADLPPSARQAGGSS